MIAFLRTRQTLRRSAAWGCPGHGQSGRKRRCAAGSWKCAVRICEFSLLERSFHANLPLVMSAALAHLKVPEDLMAFLRLVNCSGEDAFHLEALFRDAAWDHFMEPVGALFDVGLSFLCGLCLRRPVRCLSTAPSPLSVSGSFLYLAVHV